MLNNEGVWRAGEKNSHVASRCLYQSIFSMTRFECQCSVQPITTFERAFLDANHVFHVNRDRFFVRRYKCNFRNLQHEDDCVQNVLDVVVSDRSWFKQDTRAQKTEIVRRKFTKTRECWRKPILSFFFSRILRTVAFLVTFQLSESWSTATENGPSNSLKQFGIWNNFTQTNYYRNATATQIQRNDVLDTF